MGDYGDWRAIMGAHDPVKSSHALRIFFQHLSEQQHVPLSETSVEKSSWIHASQNFFSILVSANVSHVAVQTSTFILAQVFRKMDFILKSVILSSILLNGL